MCILYLLIIFEDPLGFIFMNTQINSFCIFIKKIDEVAIHIRLF